MTDLTELSSFSYQILILLSVIASKALVSHFIVHEPLRFFQFYCQKLSDKVNKPQNSTKQQAIAGLVAILITLLPILVILWMFEVLVEVDFLWQAFLLYLALGAFGLTQISKTISQAIKSKQNYVAKKTLKPWVLRETDSLSSLGLSKACIEMQFLRTLQQGYCVAFLFIFLGPLTALGFRLVLEMHYCWNTKLTTHRYFGLYSQSLTNLLAWFPVKIFSLLLLFTSAGKNFRLVWNLSRPYFFQLNNNMALLLFALHLEVKLGGVAMYQANNEKEKLRKISFNEHGKQPQAQDINQAKNKAQGIIYISLFLLILLTISIEFITANI